MTTSRSQDGDLHQLILFPILGLPPACATRWFTSAKAEVLFLLGH
jgi:hypothetical protein